MKVVPQRFLSLNKKKLPFVFFVYSLVLLTLIGLLLLIVGIANDDFPEAEAFFVIVPVTGLVMPALLLLIALAGGLWENHLYKKIWNTAPFDQLEQIGFHSICINVNFKMQFTQETKERVINGYTIRFHANKNNPKRASFIVYVLEKEMDGEQYRRLEKGFKKGETAFDFDGIVKSYNLNKLLNLTIHQVERDLIELVEHLQKEGFQPVPAAYIETH